MPLRGERHTFSHSLSNDVVLEAGKNLLGVFAIRGQKNGVHEIKAENTHNGLCIYDVTSAGQVDIDIILGNNIYKSTNILNGRKTYHNAVHNNYTSLI